MDHEHCDFLFSVADGRVELPDDYARYAGQGHDHDAHAVDGVVVVHHRDSWAAGVRSAAVGWDPAAVGPQPGHQFLRPADRRERTDYAAQGWFPATVAASVLVLRASGGLHRDFARDGRDVADSVDVLAQADFRLQGDGLRHALDRIFRVHGVGPSHVHERHEPVFSFCLLAVDHVHWRAVCHQDV